MDLLEELAEDYDDDWAAKQAQRGTQRAHHAPCRAEQQHHAQRSPEQVAAAVTAQAADPEHPTSAELAALQPQSPADRAALLQAVHQRTQRTTAQQIEGAHRPAPRLPHFEQQMAQLLEDPPADDDDSTHAEQWAWISAGSPVGAAREHVQQGWCAVTARQDQAIKPWIGASHDCVAAGCFERRAAQLRSAAAHGSPAQRAAAEAAAAQALAAQAEQTHQVHPDHADEFQRLCMAHADQCMSSALQCEQMERPALGYAAHLRGLSSAAALRRRAPGSW